MRISKVSKVVLVLLLLGTAPVSAEQPLDVKSEFNSAYRSYQAYADKGEWTKALSFAETALSLGEQLFESPNKSLAALHHNLAKSHLNVSSRTKSFVFFESALTEYEAAYGADGIELVDLLFEIGDAKAVSFKMTSQQRYYDRALEIVKKHYGESSYEYPYYVSLAGVNVLVLSHRSAAKQYLKKGYKQMEKNFGVDSQEMAFPALNQAKYYIFIKRPKKAIKYLDLAVKNLDTEKTKSDPIKLAAHGVLAQIYSDIGEDEKATKHCVAIGELQRNLPDQEPSPIVKKRPKFPALSGGSFSGGWVNVVFDINELGFVVDAKVADSGGPKAFQKSALDAINGYRYAPAFIDGNAVLTKGVEKTFRFGTLDPGQI